MTESDFDLLASFSESEEDAGTYQWFGFTSLSPARKRFEENGAIGPEGGTLVVVFDGKGVGTIDFYKTRWGRETSSCWSFGIGIKRDFRGKGIGTQAQRLIVDYLFRHSNFVRVQTFTDRENAAERRALEKAGFAAEGVVRSAQWRNGAWHDQVLYSILRDSWAKA